MHSYIKHSDDRYSVGMWLPNRDGVTAFMTMFDVADRYTAMRAVNCLNGGPQPPTTFTVTKEK